MEFEGDCSPESLPEYHLPIHIAAVFIILAASFIGTSFPIVSFHSERFRLSKYTLLIFKSFGSGVILSTGFVHMLPMADQALTNDCIEQKWLRAFDGWTGVFALLAALLTHLVQSIAILHFSHEPDHITHGLISHDHEHSPGKERLLGEETDAYRHSSSDESATVNDIEQRRLYDHSDDEVDPSSATVELGALTVAKNIHSDDCDHIDIAHVVKHHHHHRKITAYVLEFGIALHSVVIGVTIGVMREDLFGLLIAICFHQFFEGFALATTAFEAGFESFLTPALMCIMYSLTTPTGVVIGIFVAESVMQNAEVSLTTVGILNSISGGILIYDGLVNMLTVNITHNNYFASLSIRKQIAVFVSLWIGVISMSILGYWI